MELTVNRPTISLEAAAKAITAGIEKAREIGVPMSIAVVDDSGELKAFSRMDGASVVSVKVAIDKGYTVAATGFPSTSALYEFVREDGPLALGFAHVDRIKTFGGGVVLNDGDTAIGAVGVSGGHYSQDEVVAVAAAEALR